MGVPLQKVGSYVLLTRPPLITFWQAKMHSYDLHVLSIPPAFILSQDQTLRENFCFSHLLMYPERKKKSNQSSSLFLKSLAFK